MNCLYTPVTNPCAHVWLTSGLHGCLSAFPELPKSPVGASAPYFCIQAHLPILPRQICCPSLFPQPCPASQSTQPCTSWVCIACHVHVADRRTKQTKVGRWLSPSPEGTNSTLTAGDGSKESTEEGGGSAGAICSICY